MVILPLNVEASFPKWFPDFMKFIFKYSSNDVLICRKEPRKEPKTVLTVASSFGFKNPNRLQQSTGAFFIGRFTRSEIL